MDAHALLTSQGWRGKGHSLHPTTDSTGLSRPLLVSRKDNTLGVGKKQHRTSDMWWMNAFDSSLKGLDTSKQGTVVQTVTSGGLDMVTKGGARFVGAAGGGGLYASFVKGECLRGTIGVDDDDSSKSGDSGAITPIQGSGKSSGSRKVKNETKEERRARKTAKRAARENQAIAEATNNPDRPEDEEVKKTETKEERRERKRLKKTAKEAEQRSIEAAAEKAKKKKRRKD